MKKLVLLFVLAVSTIGMTQKNYSEKKLKKIYKNLSDTYQTQGSTINIYRSKEYHIKKIANQYPKYIHKDKLFLMWCNTLTTDSVYTFKWNSVKYQSFKNDKLHSRDEYSPAKRTKWGVETYYKNGIEYIPKHIRERDSIRRAKELIKSNEEAKKRLARLKKQAEYRAKIVTSKWYSNGTLIVYIRTPDNSEITFNRGGLNFRVRWSNNDEILINGTRVVNDKATVIVNMNFDNTTCRNTFVSYSKEKGAAFIYFNQKIELYK